ncbi:olfactory receptor 18-like [Talpa occidentalis]|uniref:olfactory receptor 18-like n=1 Tax=Talpa occidentalis TaxID=50954 RepID=UPI0018906A4F|nr:olfactory receptor 18-like [Talpa occidentalis]
MPEAGSPPPAASVLGPPPPGGAREPQPARGPQGPGADHCLCLGEPRNHTGVVEFFLLGLSEDPERQQLIFWVFLSTYLVTVTGNLLIILAIASDPHLHTPMYFFLSILSVADIGFTSATVPKMISGIQTHSRALSHMDCLLQLSLLYFFLCLDSALLAIMAYDRFVAICHPLHYLTTMNPRLCGLLVLASLWVSLLDSQVNCLMISQLTFCTHVDIPHFFCDPPQLIKLACEDISLYTIFMYIIGAIFGGVPVSGILFSYTQIVSSVLRVPSAGGRFKAFSTCGSHLSVVCLFYGTGIGAYLSSAVSRSPMQGMVASVVYTVVVPMLNPFIYSLRNRHIKMALQRLLSKNV